MSIAREIQYIEESDYHKSYREIFRIINVDYYKLLKEASKYHEQVKHPEMFYKLDVTLDIICNAILNTKEPTQMQQWLSEISYRISDNFIKGVYYVFYIIANTTEIHKFVNIKNGIYTPKNTLYKCTIQSLYPQYCDKVTKAHYQPPMKVPPVPYKDNRGGHLFKKDYLFIGKTRNNNKVPTEAIDILQSIPLSLYPVEPENEIEEELFKEYKDIPFYFVWNYDSNGRMYNQGYHIHLQGDERKRAMINLWAEYEITDFYWFKIDIANLYGLGKKTKQERIAWFNKNESRLESLIPKAKKPIRFEKAVKAYRKAKETGYTDYLMELDSSTSGLQIMSVVMHDREGCEYTNAINTGRYIDPPTELAKAIGLTGFSRDDVKYPLMTHFYNSKKVPKEIYKEHYPTFVNSVKKLFRGASTMLDIINSWWNKPHTSFTWELPDGFIAQHDVLETVQVHLPAFDTDNSVKLPFSYKRKVAKSKGISLPAVVVQSIDAYIARQMVIRLHKQGIPLLTIHDAFFFPPQYGNEVTQTYNHILYELARDDVMTDIANSLLKEEKYKKVKAPEWISLILEAEYAIS